MSDTEPDDATRAFAKALFGKAHTDETPEPEQVHADRSEMNSRAEPEPKEGNFVPREGTNPQVIDKDADMRAYTRELFGRDPA